MVENYVMDAIKKEILTFIIRILVNVSPAARKKKKRSGKSKINHFGNHGYDFTFYKARIRIMWRATP